MSDQHKSYSKVSGNTVIAEHFEFTPLSSVQNFKCGFLAHLHLTKMPQDNF